MAAHREARCGVGSFFFFQHDLPKSVSPVQYLPTVGFAYLAGANYTRLLFMLTKTMLLLLERKFSEANPILNQMGPLIENWILQNTHQKESVAKQQEYLQMFFLVLQVWYYLMVGQVKSVKICRMWDRHPACTSSRLRPAGSWQRRCRSLPAAAPVPGKCSWQAQPQRAEWPAHPRPGAICLLCQVSTAGRHNYKELKGTAHFDRNSRHPKFYRKTDENGHVVKENMKIADLEESIVDMMARK